MRPLVPSILLPLLFGLVAPLTACGPLPRPFKPDDQKAAVDLRAIAYDSTVVVMPLKGDTPTNAEPIVEALRDALLAEGLIATTWQDPSGALLLNGRARIRSLGGSDLLSAEWSIDGPQGTLARYEQQQALPADAWQTSDHDALLQVAEEAAAALAPQLLGPAVEEAVVPGRPGARLAVLPVTGAPGNGDEALTAALALALERAELPVAKERTEDDLAIRGTVEVTPAESGKEAVSVVWRLEDTGGKELGTIEQANTVPAGSLNGEWGGIAALVARNAVDGLSDLLDRLARQKARS